MLFSISINGFCQTAIDTSTEKTVLHKRFVGGSISYERNDGLLRSDQFFSVFNNSVQFNIQPYLGYQVGEKTQLGVTAGFTLIESDQSSSFQSLSSSEFNLGVFVRNDLMSKGNFTFLLETTASLSYEYGRNSTSPGRLTGGPYRGPLGFTFSMSPRASYDINRFRLLASFGSAGITVQSDSNTTNDINLSVGGSKIFASALNRFLGVTVEYKF